MIRARDEKMGRFSVILELANNNDVVKADEGIIRKQEVRRIAFPAVVDTGAALMVMEALDLIVDPTNQKPVPRDPKYPIYEIE